MRFLYDGGAGNDRHRRVGAGSRPEGKIAVDYARFERLTVGVGAAAIIGTATLSLGTGADPVELVALLLLLAVLFGAVRWGRRGGSIAAVAALVIYVAAKELSAAGNLLAPETLRLLAIRTVMYAVVGIAGGAACERMKALLTRAHDARAIDEASTAYTPKFLARLLAESIAQFERYSLAFSVLVISVDGRATSGMGAAEATGVTRTIATRLHRGLRLVDEVGRLPWGAFAIILPQTGRAGAEVAGDRLRADLRETLGIEDAAITVRTLTASDDLEAIRALSAEADATGSDSD
jgi:GGDEF domain-containing protein